MKFLAILLLVVGSTLSAAEFDERRDVVDFLINSFGLGQVWQTIQQSGQNLFAQFQAVLTQLLFAGQTAWNNSKPIFGQLVQVCIVI